MVPAGPFLQTAQLEGEAQRVPTSDVRDGVIRDRAEPAGGLCRGCAAPGTIRVRCTIMFLPPPFQAEPTASRNPSRLMLQHSSPQACLARTPRLASTRPPKELPRLQPMP